MNFVGWLRPDFCSPAKLPIWLFARDGLESVSSPALLVSEAVFAKDLCASNQATKQPFRSASGLVDAVHHATSCPERSDN